MTPQYFGALSNKTVTPIFIDFETQEKSPNIAQFKSEIIEKHWW